MQPAPRAAGRAPRSSFSPSLLSVSALSVVPLPRPLVSSRGGPRGAEAGELTAGCGPPEVPAASAGFQSPSGRKRAGGAGGPAPELVPRRRERAPLARRLLSLLTFGLRAVRQVPGAARGAPGRSER